MRRVPLKHLVRLNPETLPETTSPDFAFDYIDIGAVRRDTGITSTERMCFRDAPSRARRVVRTNDVIVSTVRTYLRAVASIDHTHDGQVCSTGFAVLRPRSEINPRYLHYVATALFFVEEVVARSAGVSYPAINASDLVRIAVPLPSLEEQDRVAAFLDEETTRIDRLTRSCDELSATLQEPALATFVALTQGRPMTRLGYHFEVQLGKMLDEDKASAGELVPYLRNQNVDWDRFWLEDIKQMRLTERDRARYLVRRGDLLACEGRHVGKCAIWAGSEEPIYYQKALHRIRPRADWSNRYLLWCLWLGNSRGDFYADGTGSTIPHLPAEKLRAVRVPFATREEQDAIVRQVDRVHRAARAAREAIDTFRIDLGEYRDALVTELINGTLEPQLLSERRYPELASLATADAGSEFLA